MLLSPPTKDHHTPWLGTLCSILKTINITSLNIPDSDLPTCLFIYKDSCVNTENTVGILPTQRSDFNYSCQVQWVMDGNTVIAWGDSDVGSLSGHDYASYSHLLLCSQTALSSSKTPLVLKHSHSAFGMRDELFSLHTLSSSCNLHLESP